MAHLARAVNDPPCLADARLFPLRGNTQPLHALVDCLSPPPSAQHHNLGAGVVCPPFGGTGRRQATRGACLNARLG